MRKLMALRGQLRDYNHMNMRKIINLIESERRAEEWRVWFDAKTGQALPVTDLYDHRAMLLDDPEEFRIDQTTWDKFEEIGETDSELAGDFLMYAAFKNGWVRINAGHKTTVSYLFAGSPRYARLAAKWILKQGFAGALSIEIGSDISKPILNHALNSEEIDDFVARGTLPYTR